MRLLHTSDWHAGCTLHRRQRLEETEAVLREIVEVARNEEVDLVLVCGDIFESFSPSAEAERIVYETFLALSLAGIPALAIAGNHDYARRWLAIQALFEALDVHVRPEVRRPTDGGIVEIEAEDGETAQIAALPWVAERALFGAEEMMGLQGEPYQAYAERLPELITALCAFDPDKVNVLAAHLFVSGAKPGGGERELTIGEIFAVNAAALPTTPQYIALGHVHRPQEVPGCAVPARYSGSPLQLDFGETEQAKSVTIVDVEPGRPAKTRQVALKQGRKLLDLEVPLDAIDDVEVDPDAYLRVFLQCEGPTPGLVDHVREVLPNAVEVRLDYEREDPGKRAAELRSLTPTQLFDRYYRQRHGAKPEEALSKLFSELFEEVTNATAAD